MIIAVIVCTHAAPAEFKTGWSDVNCERARCRKRTLRTYLSFTRDRASGQPRERPSGRTGGRYRGRAAARMIARSIHLVIHHSPTAHCPDRGALPGQERCPPPPPPLQTHCLIPTSGQVSDRGQRPATLAKSTACSATVQLLFTRLLERSLAPFAYPIGRAQIRSHVR